jgi:hypothetical protein
MVNPKNKENRSSDLEMGKYISIIILMEKLEVDPTLK